MTPSKSQYRSDRLVIAAAVTCWLGCTDGRDSHVTSEPLDSSHTVAEIELAVNAFHAADTAMDAEAVIDLLWPDYYMFADGTRLSYDDVATGSREFMASLELFRTEWTDLRITAIGPDVAISSFRFRDSIVTKSGELIRSQGPTAFVWQRRNGEWRVIFADADHYPLDQPGN